MPLPSSPYAHPCRTASLPYGPPHPAPPVQRERRSPMAPTLTLKPGTAWGDAWQRCLAVAPEAFQ
ncbi:hypothetical protein GWI24_30725, partial [Streptomyces sp. MK37H]|nr:hypothetical protein [Streptomyces sp. MK37H]